MKAIIDYITERNVNRLDKTYRLAWTISFAVLSLFIAGIVYIIIDGSEIAAKMPQSVAVPVAAGVNWN